MTSERVIKEAPVPVAHGWRVDEGRTPHEGRGIMNRFVSDAFVSWADSEGYFPCTVRLSNGQIIIVRAKK